MDSDAICRELAKPLDPKHVKPAKKFGPKGDYIEAWHAQAEANRIFGHLGWSQEIIGEPKCVMQAERKLGRDQKDGWGVTYTVRVRVSAHGKVSEDFGAGHGYDVDLGLAHESAIKEAVSDAVKRALKAFGNPFGLALYDKSRENVRPPEMTAEDAIVGFAHQGDLDSLRGYWVALGPARDLPGVLAAKDKRKSDLEQAA